MLRENQATDSEQDAPTITVEGPGQDDKLDLNDMKNVFIASAPTPKRLAQILEAILNRGQARTPFFKFVDDKGASVDEPLSSEDLEVWNPTWEIFDDNPKGLPKSTGLRERLREMWPSSFGDLTMSPDGMTPGFSWNRGIPGAFHTVAYSRSPEGGLRKEAALHTWIRQFDMASLTKLERPYVGRLWYVLDKWYHKAKHVLTLKQPFRILPTLRESISDQHSTLSLEHIALVMNYCQTVNGRIGRNVAEDSRFYPALQFLGTFIYPWSSTLTNLQFGIIGPPRNAVDLVMHWHLRSLVRELQFAPGAESAPTGPRVFVERQRAMLRGSSREYDGSSHPVPLREIVYSTSLCILNTDKAPYTVLLLADEPRSLVRPGTLAPVIQPITEGIVLDGRCAGLAHFMLLMSQVLRQWEDDWMDTLNAIDSVSEFHVRFTFPSGLCTTLTAPCLCSYPPRSTTRN